jgi:hypothetical protein
LLADGATAGAAFFDAFGQDEVEVEDEEVEAEEDDSSCAATASRSTSSPVIVRSEATIASARGAHGCRTASVATAATSAIPATRASRPETPFRTMTGSRMARMRPSQYDRCAIATAGSARWPDIRSDRMIDRRCAAYTDARVPDASTRSSQARSQSFCIRTRVDQASGWNQ